MVPAPAPSPLRPPLGGSQGTSHGSIVDQTVSPPVIPHFGSTRGMQLPITISVGLRAARQRRLSGLVLHKQVEHGKLSSLVRILRKKVSIPPSLNKN